MRRLALAIALACVLSGVTRAGEIHTTGAVTPPGGGHGRVASDTPSVATTAEIPTTDEIASDASSTAISIFLTLINIVS